MESLLSLRLWKSAISAVSRGSFWGVLRVNSGGRSAHCTFQAGRLVGISGLPHPMLGDVLHHAGLLSPEALRALCSFSESTEDRQRVGSFLVTEGLITTPQLHFALYAQARSQLAEVVAWEHPELSVSSSVARTCESISFSAVPLFAGALRRRLLDLPVDVVAVELPRSFRSPNSSPTAGLNAAELAVRSLLQTGVTAEELRVQFGPTVVHSLFLLLLLGETGPRPGRGRYGWLLRKERQIRRGVRGKGLLGLSTQASPQEARRALRRAARSAHPDVYATDSAPAVTRASERVMAALLQAERAALDS